MASVALQTLLLSLGVRSLFGSGLVTGESPRSRLFFLRSSAEVEPCTLNQGRRRGALVTSSLAICGGSGKPCGNTVKIAAMALELTSGSTRARER